jgi:hypothetical protein
MLRAEALKKWEGPDAACTRALGNAQIHWEMRAQYASDNKSFRSGAIKP